MHPEKREGGHQTNGESLIRARRKVPAVPQECKEFAPTHKSGAFVVDQVLEALQTAAAGGGK
jgi:hypothetical protein